MKRTLLALLMLTLAIPVAGCAVQKTVTITPRPADALIRVNGTERGKGTIVERMTFQKPESVVFVSASRKGFQDRSVSVTRDSVDDMLIVELRPHVRRISITTSPVPAIISIDGKPLTAEPVSAISADVEFTVDAQDNWITHTITAERTGFIKDQQSVTWTDAQTIYAMKLDAMRKDIKITTNPAGATVFINGKEIGKSPVVDRQRAFEFDTSTNAWQPHALRLEKPGYDPIERKIDWDSGQSDYAIDLIPKQKTVKIITDPPGATVVIDGAIVREQDGALTADLIFTPIDEAGTLRTFTAKLSKKTNEAIWYPAELSIPWEEGKTDYTVKLREVLSQSTPGLALSMQREKRTWALVADAQATMSMKFVTELDAQSPQRVIDLPADQSVGSISVSPDGQFLVYTAVSAKSPNEPASQMFRVRTDGTGGAGALSDGRSIDLSPSFTAAGDRIVYSSNRASEKFSIWSISAAGEGGVTRFTTGDTNDLYPSVDAEAKPRLFYQAHIDTRADPRLYVVQLGTNLQTDLTRLGGTQPRISPRGDSVVYVSANEKTGLRDLYRVSDQGGAPESLTSQGNNIDPSWNAAGTRIAFSSDRGKEAEDGRANFDIWVLDLANPNTPKQITNNGSVDDMPVFDPAGDAIYFRSNRGGAWGIWKISVR